MISEFMSFSSSWLDHGHRYIAQMRSSDQHPPKPQQGGLYITNVAQLDSRPIENTKHRRAQKARPRSSTVDFIIVGSSEGPDVE
jgi:hypothetical protein